MLIVFAMATAATLIPPESSRNQDCEQGGDWHPGAALNGALDGLRHRLGERVRDIDVRQGAAVLRLSAGASPATAST
jgi:hypothetical protein